MAAATGAVHAVTIVRRRQADPDAPARIFVRLAPGTVAVSVRDTGSGVPASVGPRVLEPFATSKRHGEGAGLPLPVAASIARGVGGHVCWRKAAPGQPQAGAVFRLVFPAAGATDAGSVA